MASLLVALAALAAALLPAAVAAEASLPRRDLLVELREAEASQAPSGAPGWSARSADARTARERPPQQLRVHNGASASLRLTLTRPLQVWQAVPGVLWSLPLAGTQWIETGRSLTVQPRWPGGREPVIVALSTDASRLDPVVAPGSAELPQRSQTQLTTTLAAPLGEWVTLAETGDADPHLVASGQAAADSRRMLQLRVSLAR